MNRKTVIKVVAAFLAFMLSFANVALLGSYGISYAADANLEEQTTQVKKAEIEFDAYFQDEGENVHTKVFNVDEQDKLYMNIKVDEGYLVDGTIKIENANFKIQETDEEFEMIQSISEDAKTIALNQIRKDETVALELPIAIDTDSNFDVSNLSKVASITLQGKYVNDKGKTIDVEKKIEVEASIDGEAESSLTQEISKYVTFDVNGSKGVILQTSIKSKLVDNKLPVKQTKLEIEVPEINNIEPKTITLMSKSTMATNGQEGKVFTDEDYTYEDGKIKLLIENNNEILSWLKDVEDEIILTCIYSEDAIVDYAEVSLNSESEITYYAKEQKIANQEFSQEIELTEQIGDIVTLGVDTEESLYKGYMLVENAKNTAFANKLSLNIGYAEIMDKITFKDETTFVDESENTYPLSALYTYTKISKENLVEILGEDGYINVYKEDGTIITTLNKENTEYKFEEEISNVLFETSKPQTIGILEIENGREIKPLEYSKVQEEMFKKVRVNLNANIMQNDVNIISGNTSTEIELLDTTSQAEFKMSKENLSTVVENEDVELRVTLKTTDASTALYKNPVAEITLPKYVTNIDIENVKLVYEEELKIAEAIMYKNDNGNIVIRIALDGEQTAYNDDAVTEGATLVMNANIKANSLTPTKKENIILDVTNEQTEEKITTYNEIKFVAPAGIATVSQIAGFNDKGDTVVSISGNKGIGELQTKASTKQANIKILAINNYEYNMENVVILGRTPFEGNKTIAENKDLGSTFTAKVVSGINAISGIENSQITVYYSENGQATKDLNTPANGWKTDINEVSNVKSYMIVLNDYTFNTGDILGFEYNVEIPENLERNQETYEVFAVYANRQEESEIAQIALAGNEVESTPAGVSTGEGPNLEVTVKNELQAGAIVVEKDYVKYTVTVKNNGTKTVNNVKVTIPLPNQSFFTEFNEETGNYGASTTPEEKILTIDSIEAGKSKDVVFYLRVGFVQSITESPIEGKTLEECKKDIMTREEYVNKRKEELRAQGKNIEIIPEEDFEDGYDEYAESLEEYNSLIQSLIDQNVGLNELTVSVKATVDGFEDEFTSNVLKNNIEPASEHVKLSLTGKTNLYDEKALPGKEINYNISVYASTNNTVPLQNAKLEVTVPDGMTFVSAQSEGKYNETSRKITWDLGETVGYMTYSFKLVVDDLPSGTYSRTLKVDALATCSNEGSYPGTLSLETLAYKDGFEISQSANVKEGSEVAVGDEIIYEITVKNIGDLDTTAKITDTATVGLSLEEYYYVQNGETVSKTFENEIKSLSIECNIASGETLKIYVKAKTVENKNDIDITNKASVTFNKREELFANEITHKLIGSLSNSGNGGNNESGGNTNVGTGSYRISGVAWVDANKNGMRDSNEEKLTAIKVYLLNSSTNTVIANTTTDGEGNYTFTGIKQGNYIVAFEYDTMNYALTTYQANGVDSNLNSDVINMILNLSGTSNTYAATNTLNVNGNLSNIDLGLVVSPTFDLELTKGIDLMQVSNSKGVETYRFGNSDTAKVEIPEKQMKGSVVAITYTIKVTNTGVVPGYANKIVDYKAKDLSFSSTLNPEWYQDSDGNLYTTSLAGTIINPGETKEIQLVLTKSMTGENTGVSSNIAEIAECSNDLGVQDIDSAPGNRNAKEDDLGTADVYITIKTGGILFYGGILLVVLVIFALRSL